MSVALTSEHTQVAVLGQLRKRYLWVLTWFSIIFGTFVALVQIGVNISQASTIFSGVFVLISILILRLIPRQTRLATLIMLSLYVLAALTASTMLTLLSSLALVSTAVLGNRWTFVVANIAILGRIIIYALSQPLSPDGTPSADATNAIMLLIALGAVSFTIRFFIEAAQNAAYAAQRSAQLLNDIAVIGQELAQLLKLDDLLPQAVELIRRSFAFYHVQVFLVDKTHEFAELTASTGAVGRELLSRKHRLAVGSQSVIGRTTKEKHPVIARYTDTFYFRNELLPDTRSELALPIMDGEQVIGALDVQSRNPTAFQPDEVQALQTLANLLATSIRNARLFAEQSQIAQETKRLFLESESNLREIQRLNRQFTKQGWKDYWREAQHTGLTLDDQQIFASETWSDQQIKAARTRRPVQDGEVVAAPLMIGNEVIGAIEVEVGGEIVQSEAAEIVNAVAQRLALSLDKARLFEESQDMAAQEQRINEIVARYQTVANVDDLLRITLSELSLSLGAKHGAIRLGSLGTNENGSSGS
ncbi:MAG: GAF domain-containing protein [Anaerolineae bacterium]|nr:GAF domain-containing protein [Anaerolineae bacterium]